MTTIQQSPTFGQFNISKAFVEQNKKVPAESKANKAFHENYVKWAETQRALFVEFKPEWNNGTGYLDDLAKVSFFQEHGIAIGACIFSFDPVTRRRIAIIVGRYGNIVIFDRFTDGDGSVFVLNTVDIYKPMLPSSAMSADHIYNAFSVPEVDSKHNQYYEGTMYKFEKTRRAIYKLDGVELK